jgi:hypothetical protein
MRKRAASKPRQRGTSESPDSPALIRICRLLEILVRLGLEKMKTERPQGEMIIALDKIGCGQSEIAELLGTTPNTVNVTLYKSKKNKSKSKR